MGLGQSMEASGKDNLDLKLPRVSTTLKRWLVITQNNGWS